MMYDCYIFIICFANLIYFQSIQVKLKYVHFKKIQTKMCTLQENLRFMEQNTFFSSEKHD